MEETQSKMWFSGVAVLPYLVLAGLYTWLIHGHRKDFMVAAVVLIGGRILYGVLDSITSSIAWRVYARKRTTAKMRKLFEDEGLPMRRYPAETLSLYLLRIENDQDEQPHSVAVKCAARELSTLIEQAKHDGLLKGARMERAITDAYDRHTISSTVQNPLGVN